MRVNPATRTSTPRYAPGRRPRADQGACARNSGSTREVSNPRACHRTHVRSVGPTRAARNAGSSRLEQFRMQFDWVNFQQCPQTLQFQRYGYEVRHGVGGIACDIRGKLAGRESCTTTYSTVAPLAPGGGGHEKSTPTGVLFINAEPPPVDRTEGGRCAPEGTRTPNLLNRNQMLYPLSYGGGARCAACKTSGG